MRDIYLDFLYLRGYLVGKEVSSSSALRTLKALDERFGIQILSGQELAHLDVEVYVATRYQRDLGIFDRQIRREGAELKKFRILSESEAEVKLGEYVAAMLTGINLATESKYLYQLLREYARDYHHILPFLSVKWSTADFLEGIYGKETVSVYLAFEEMVKKGDISGAAKYLAEKKGSVAVLQNLDVLLHGCKTEGDVEAVFEYVQTQNIPLLIQLLIQYSEERETNLCAKPGDMTIATLFYDLQDGYLKASAANRKYDVPKPVINKICRELREHLAAVCQNKLGKVYVDKAMKKVAAPLPEYTSLGNLNELPRGTRIPIGPGERIRVFTCWDDNLWGSMQAELLHELGYSDEYFHDDEKNSAVMCFHDHSYTGGYAYIDVVLTELEKKYPEYRYVFFSCYEPCYQTMNECVCRTGYVVMGEKTDDRPFDPRTAAPSYRITGDGSAAYLFAIDLENREMVWLNSSREGILSLDSHLWMDAGTPLRVTEIISFYDLAILLTSQVVDTPEEADVVFSDRALTLPEGVEQFRSCDFEKILCCCF